MQTPLEQVLTNGSRQASALRVEVVFDGGRTLWQLFADGRSSGYASVYDLTTALKQLLHNGSTDEAKTL